MGNRTILLQQLSSRMQSFATLQPTAIPPSGWIKAIRLAVGMSLEQLGKKLSVSKQAILDMERREQEGAVTLKSLREIARVLDMQLVYGFIPNSGSMEALIEKRARELATEIVMRTSGSMALEDQANSDERLKSAIEERTTLIKNEMPRIIWD